jgi:ABC-type transport system involved in cytochrome c biogenesis permease subunit
MKQGLRTVIAALVLVAGGIVLSFFPQDWIETLWSFDPDGGSGLLESLLVAVPLLFGFMVLVASLRRPARRNQQVKPAKPLLVR